MKGIIKNGNHVNIRQNITNYFKRCEASNKPATISGLCNVLGVSRKYFLDIINGKYKYDRKVYDSLLNAFTKIEEQLEEKLYCDKNVTGPIFSLKSNYEWDDKAGDNININNYDSLTEEQLEKLILEEKSKLSGDANG